MKINNLAGQDFFDARTYVGLSITAAAKNTGINRNTLSNFEREKSTLTIHEKRKLFSFYQDRGYDFSVPEHTELKVLQQHNTDTVEQVKEIAESEMSPVVGEALSDLADSINDLVTVSLIESTRLVESDEIASIGMMDVNAENEDYQSLNDRLVDHFKADKSGETKGKVSFFGESASGRSEKLVALLALQYLRTLKVKHPDFIALSLDETEDKTDNKRLLDVLDNCLNYESLGEFKDITGEQVQ
ncbi:helix-turn-helix domain-containing protein [Vibrio crassostreae]|uniref:helix-turn-helix domain-containing protein n=1 Tax=Vibrio crassostreae TaxID=246167 RepID=UPI0010428FAD|nr:helix-turn-helix transcriptional regulator [Vibrio crassostreae]TCW21821.1 hypothetical protein EDB48_102431 [Vibrio crassostreae]